MLALAHKERLFLEKPRLLPCVTKWFKANKVNSNSKRFGDLTPALAAQVTRKKIRMASPGGLDTKTLDESVQALSLNALEDPWPSNS